MPAPPICPIEQRPLFYQKFCLCAHCKLRDKCPKKSDLQTCYVCLGNIENCDKFIDEIIEKYNKGLGLNQ